MAAVINKETGEELTDIQKNIMDKISKNEVSELKVLLGQLKDSVEFADSSGMTPLQHACYKGSKEAVQLLLDQGAAVNSSKHEYNYSALHFAALSGNLDVCLLLLLAGAKPHALNSVGRTPAQMAAFVTNHQVVATINNFVPKSDVEYYTKLQGQQTEPYLPVILLDAMHKFAIQINFHPVRIALNLKSYGLYNPQYLKIVKNVLDLMCEREMKRRNELNEVLAFKFHYLGWIVNEIDKCREHFQNRREQNTDKEIKSDYIELFAKRVLKQNKDGILDYVESTIRDCVREFPYRESTLFRQIVAQLVSPDNCATALEIIKASLNNQRGFSDLTTACSSCGEEKPDKKCSKCKEVQYCDRECQRLHWFMHKKECARPSSASQADPNAKPVIDAAEINEQLQKLVTG